MVGLLHSIALEGDRSVKVGYQLDYDLTQGANFVYVGNRFQSGFAYNLFPTDPNIPKAPWSNLRLSYYLDVHLRRYRNVNTQLPVLNAVQPNGLPREANLKPREDNEYNHIVRLTLPLAGPADPSIGFPGGNVAFLSKLPRRKRRGFWRAPFTWPSLDCPALGADQTG